MRNCDIKFVNKEITPFGGLSLFFKMLEIYCCPLKLFYKTSPEAHFQRLREGDLRSLEF